MLKKFFPFLDWFRNYGLDDARIDAISGLTVALVLIPQSMAYAQLAGLPPYYGLYASFLPPMIAALFGSSRQLATGPVAVVSLMTSASLEPLATAGSEGYIAYAILLALIVGVFQLSLGILRLGLVVNFLSHPVVNGFTNAAAIIIASSQLSKMFGVYVDKSEHHYETIIRVCEAAIYYTHWPTLFMGIAAFGIMYGLRRIAPKIPNVLVAVMVTTLISWYTGFEHNTTVDISAIESPQVREWITEFNNAVNAIPPLADERTQVSETLDKAKSSRDNIAVLDAEHDMNVLTIKIERLKHEAHVKREHIREVLFEQMKTPDGSLKFYSKDKSEGDRTWRIKIGNKPLDLEKLLMTGGGAVVGMIPKGLPALTVPKIDFKIILHLLPYAAIISLLGFMEAISIAKAMAARTGQRLDPNQELIGQGLANIFGSIGKSYPTSGSFSRSAVNLQTGSVSGLSSVFTSLAVVIVLLFFTPLLYHLPQSVLAAVIMMAVIGLINVTGFVHAWRAQWYDGLISVISFVCTLGFAPHLDKGIMVGVVLSLGVFLYKSMRPKVSSLSRHDDEALRDAFLHDLMECRYVDLIRFDGPLFFANASYLEDIINERIINKKDLKHIIIASNGINDIDASGEEALSLIIDNTRSTGVDISLSGVNESVMAVLRRTHLLEEIGQDHVYPTMEKAICAVHEHTHQEEQEDRCPLTTVCRVVKQENI
ncbi:SulP family inorganic anion transporter [Desulfonema magnum]|uniref:Sodium-independent anion transporter n=1 Tax=Desulfonema magnum TaxID=45655 RepID=A0A975BW91_9BACT|nr:SulP family inorganic anion transporter [Desulfonema magnum]QTA92305.1 Putative sodium-independent anion transporter [Desulfonema magnum]